MPYYDHDKDYPFAAFITNLGKYNEGELVGEWVKFPTTAEELKEVFKRIGIGQKDDFGQPYEEWFITDYDCYVDGLYSKLGEYENLDELNYLASKLDEMSESEYAQFQAGMEMGDHCGSLQEIINLTENLDCYEVYPDIHDYDDLGRYYIEELDVMQVPEHLQNYIDYEAYGRDIALEEGGEFTDLGYVRDTGSSFHEYYDGERGSIPEEYRVMAYPAPEILREESKVQPEAAAPTKAPQPVTPILLNGQNSAERMKEITDRLETGIQELFESERYKAYLTTMSKFHSYSFNNTLLIAMQGGQLVAGYNKWRDDFHRNVKRGEKGIKILAPAPYKVKKEVPKLDEQGQPVMDKDGNPVTEKKEIQVPAFKIVSVFDVSQTEGEPLPSIGVEELLSLIHI